MEALTRHFPVATGAARSLSPLHLRRNASRLLRQRVKMACDLLTHPAAGQPVESGLFRNPLAGAAKLSRKVL